MSINTNGATDEYDDLQFGDTLRYVGPDEFGDQWAAPGGIHGPYEFRHVSVGGTLSLETRFKAPRHLAPEHPANNRNYWERVEQ
jgi:hypothetical protein